MDRLTTLMTQFHLSVRAAPPAAGNLVVLGDDAGQPLAVKYFTKAEAEHSGNLLWLGQVEWSARVNPFLAALPDIVSYDITRNPEAQGLVQLICAETAGRHCGAQSVIGRLAEVLMVHLLRDQMRRGATTAGLLAGLADPRISRAVVAIHDRPGVSWSNATLAAEAGLSLSRFAELFAQKVGETPMGYLRRWRLILAERDLKRGARVDAVARRYAYASGEAFSRAFRKYYGVSPMAVRKGETL